MTTQTTIPQHTTPLRRQLIDWALEKLDTLTDKEVFIGLCVAARGMTFEEAEKFVSWLLEHGDIVENPSGTIKAVNAR